MDFPRHLMSATTRSKRKTAHLHVLRLGSPTDQGEGLSTPHAEKVLLGQPYRTNSTHTPHAAVGREQLSNTVC